jgi:hypothetical protein
VFFARDRRGYSQWRVRIAPALGLVGLGVTLVLILTNLEGLAGSNALGWARRLGAAAGAGRLHRGRFDRTGGPAAGARHPRQSMLSPSRATIAFSYSTRCLAKARYSACGRYSFGMSQRLMIAWLASSS